MTPDLPHDPDRDALEAALAGRGEYELFACDPALADTATFCAAYGFDPADSANTIVVVGKGTPPVYAACVVLATHRLAVNQSVKARFGRKSSFASPEETQRDHRPRDRRGDGLRAAAGPAGLGGRGRHGPASGSSSAAAAAAGR